MDIQEARDRFRRTVTGLWPAVPTPLTHGGEVDRQACAAIVAHVRDDAAGLWVMGTGAGFASLASSQRHAAIDAYFEASDGTMPIMVGVSDNSLATIRENLRALDGHDPVAVFGAAPHFYIYDEEDIETYFRTIADVSSYPFVIYHNDTNTKTSLSLDLVAALSEHPNIVGIKDSTCDLGYHLRLIERFGDRDDFRIISGDDWGIAFGPAVGTAAFVAAAPLIAPSLVRSLKEAVESGDIAHVRPLQRLHTRLVSIYGLRGGTDSGFLAAQAAALHVLGLSTAMTPEPCRPPDEQEIAEVRGVLESVGLIAR